MTTKPTPKGTPAPEGRVDPKIKMKLKLEAMYGTPSGTGKAAANRPGPDDKYLVDLYTGRRWKVDPEYDPDTDRSVLRCMVQLRKLLAINGIPRPQWAAYMTCVFEEFPRITGGRCIFPPPGNVCTERAVTQFVSTLGQRKYDADSAARILRGGGFGDVHPATVLAVAVLAKRNGGKAPGREEGGRVVEAAEWLAPRLATVGYAVGGGK